MTDDPLAAGDAIARANNTRVFGPALRESKAVALQIVALDKQIEQLSWMPASTSASRAAEIDALKVQRAALQVSYDTIIATAVAEHAADFAPAAAAVSEYFARVAELQGKEKQLAQIKTMGNHPSAAGREALEAEIAALTAEVIAFVIPPYGAP